MNKLPDSKALDDDSELPFVMDELQRNLGKRKPIFDAQIKGEKPQSAESANSTDIDFS
ncbi:hypothetical protein K9692_004722 [Escherichia coli]|uniref:hypothetical protein n=1 Tax=Buttiauxella gaviniae TaxID=82990 RepID=UPI001D8B5141|nr:hypothetical protein [Escherichia coli]